MRRVQATIIVFTLVAPGCYTVLRHPRVDSPELASEPIPVRGACAACHSDLDLQRFGYTLYPEWYPTSGPWPGWYWDPWWMGVAMTDPSRPRVGERTLQGSGLPNDRSPSGSVTPGIWTPPGTLPPPAPTIVDVPPPRPGASAPGAPPAAPARDLGGRRGANRETPHERQGEPTQSPTGRGGDSRSAEPAEQPREGQDAGSAEPGEVAKPGDASRNQGQGMANDRQAPKP